MLDWSQKILVVATPTDSKESAKANFTLKGNFTALPNLKGIFGFLRLMSVWSAGLINSKLADGKTELSKLSGLVCFR